MKYSILSLSLILFVSAANAQFAGGDGSESDPFQIEDVNQLQAMKDYLDQHFVLIADIDASQTSGWNDGDGFDPIGWGLDSENDNPFTGSFNGDGFEITNLHIDRPGKDFIGLFGSIYDATLEYVILIDGSINGGAHVGGLAGRNTQGVIQNSQTSLKVNGNQIAGGLVGSSNGLVINSFSTGPVSGQNARIGGLIGTCGGEVVGSYAIGMVSGSNLVGGLAGSSSADIINSYASGDVSGQSHVGGLAGSSDRIITKSYASGNVDGDSHIGGLAGRNRGMVSFSFATGNVTGIDKVGGLIGKNENPQPNHPSGVRRGGIVTSSWSHSVIDGENETGGLVGANTTDSEISHSYFRGKLSGDDFVGGVAGTNDGVLIGTYWNLEESDIESGVGIGSSEGTFGLTSNQMTGESAFDHMLQFDFYNIWLLTENYPALFWEDEESVDPPPIAVTLLHPQNEQKAVSINDTLQWRNNKWIEDYRIIISTEPIAVGLVIDSTISDTIFVFESMENGTTYYWSVEPIHKIGESGQSDTWKFSTVSATYSGNVNKPFDFHLHQNIPNPFNPETVIRFDIPADGVHVRLTVYDMLGRQVVTLIDEMRDAGRYEVNFDAGRLSTGAYVYRLEAGNLVMTRKMMLLK